MKKTWIIYLHKNKINGMCYVGQTSQSIAQRWGHSGGQYKGQKFYDAQRLGVKIITEEEYLKMKE